MRCKRLSPFLILFLWLLSSASVFAAKGDDPLEPEGDITPPTITAYISGGYLNINGFDESGISAFFVNGYEYDEVVDDSISFRLQKFDATVQYFKIRAIDTAGNASSVYKVLNPYFDDNPTDNDDKGLSTLPEDGSKSDPSGAKALVLSHAKTDSYGNLIAGTAETYGEEVIDGKDFYTIKAESGKIFYLIIDRKNGDETVYFLTEVSENDLLNVTDGEGNTLTKNSASLEAGASSESSSQTTPGRWDEGKEKETSSRETVNKITIKPNLKILVIFGIVGVVVVLGYFVTKKKKSADDAEDDDDSDEDDEEDEY